MDLVNPMIGERDINMRWKARVVAHWPIVVEAETEREARTAIAQKIGDTGGPKFRIVFQDLSTVVGCSELELWKDRLEEEGEE